VQVKAEFTFKELVVRFHDWNILEFDMACVEAILAVAQLHELADRVSHRAVVVHLSKNGSSRVGCNHKRLHGLDETTLNVSGLSSLDGSVDETLATTHRVEEELGGREAGEVRILDEAA